MLHTARTAALASPLPPQAVVVDWAALTVHRDFLVRFARRRLLDPALAEDLVHDVFEAVMTGRASFGGRSALRSWLVAILKHKIVDLVRERCTLDSLDQGDDDGEPQHDIECPQPRPDEQADQRQQLRQALARIAALPAGLRQAFELRVLHDQSTEQVCETLSISADNLFVRLHRARRQLLS
jgi:RNA polymerase sigma-70 factor (ECF subfamily)